VESFQQIHFWAGGSTTEKPLPTSGKAHMPALLVIDEDSTIRELLHQFFSKGYECDTADRAEQALQYLEFKEYDAIITDAFMPDIGGLQIMKRIQQRHLTTPVIVISGKGDRFREFFMEMGAFEYFTKPLHLERLELAVTQAIAHHQQLHDPGFAQ
jgi:DNA-binding NtrC family response regulator